MTYEMACEAYQREAEYWASIERAVEEEFEKNPDEYEGLDDEETFEKAHMKLIEEAKRWI